MTRLSWIGSPRWAGFAQIMNVFRGEMSLIGPRPDYYKQARVFLKSIPGYRERHAVMAGISGYAPTEVGYVQGGEATRAKVRLLEAIRFVIATRVQYSVREFITWTAIERNHAIDTAGYAA